MQLLAAFLKHTSLDEIVKHASERCLYIRTCPLEAEQPAGFDNGVVRTDTEARLDGVPQSGADLLGRDHVRLSHPARQVVSPTEELHPLMIDAPQKITRHPHPAALAQSLCSLANAGANTLSRALVPSGAGDSERRLFHMHRALHPS